MRSVLFDLDGTLADTAPDLAFALNTLMGEEGLPPLPYARIRPFVSHGASALLRLGFGMEPDSTGFQGLRERFLDIYHTHLTRATQLFPEMPELLSAIEDHGLSWGVVTNKPAWLTEPLMAGLGLRDRAGCIVSGDSTPCRKPHPEPMLHACRQLGVSPPYSLYVGDAQRDIEAGRRAGMTTLIALFGYIDDADQPAQWQADGMIDHPLAILDWLTTGAGRPA